MKKVVAIIQARMGSSRLPGKVLMDISGKPMVERVVNRVRGAQKINEIVLAIPDSQDNDILENFAKKCSIAYYRGSEENVLERYYMAAKYCNADVIVRITADCPLIDKDIIDLVANTHLKQNNDFTSNALEQTFPLGISVEVMNFLVLENAYRNATKGYQKEHVTPYIIENAKKKSNVRAKTELQRPEIRLTVDEKEDLDLVRKVYQHFNNEDYFGLKEIIEFLDLKPELLNINAHIQQKKTKD